MRIPKYIRQKLLLASANAQKIAELMNEAQAWFEKQGFTSEELRSGNGCSLEEFEYGTGNDQTVDTLEDYLSLLEIDHILNSNGHKKAIDD